VRSLVRSFTTALALVPLAAAAQTPPATPPAAGAPEAKPASEPPKPPPWYSQITVNGSVDAYYGLRLDAAQDAPVLGRAFDAPTGFVPGNVRLGFGMAPAPAGFRIDLGYGLTAGVIDATSAAAAREGGTSPTAGIFVQQAYAAMKFGPVEVNLGRFVTSAGAEVIDAKDNWLYSRSFTFNLEPLTHTGLRATLPLSETVSLTLGVNNGWDVVTTGYSGKTFQGTVAWTGPSSSTLAVTAYVGNNPTVWSGAANTTGETRTFIDGVAGTTVGALDLSLNFDYGTENSLAYWSGSAMARLHLPSDVARITGRFEYAKDLDGARFPVVFAGTPSVSDASYWEATLGLSLPVGSNSELRVEGRYDKTSEDRFAKPGATDSQITALVAALAWF
jgi:hypothetical protein